MTIDAILVPLDGSKRAEAILPHVEALAARDDARLVILRVVEAPSFMIVPPGQPDMTPDFQEIERRSGEVGQYLEAMERARQKRGIQVRSGKKAPTAEPRALLQ